MPKDLKDLFVPYEIAVQLKELGFNERGFGFYELEKLAISTWMNTNSYLEIDFEEGKPRITAPTFSQCFRWFREKYNLLGCTQYFTGGYYCYTINDMKDTKESNRLFTEFPSFKEAEIACLKKLIEIVKSI